MTILREKSVLLSLKKNSPSSFPFPLFLRSFWTKKKFEIRAKREEIRFLAFSLLVLSSRIALKSLSSSHRFFFFRGLSKGRGGGVPRETFKARARHNDETSSERWRRERERENLFFFKSAKCFLSPRLKPPSKQDQKAKKKETYRREQRGGGGRSDGRLGELFRHVGRLDDRLVDRTVVLMIREVSISTYTSKRRRKGGGLHHRLSLNLAQSSM